MHLGAHPISNPLHQPLMVTPKLTTNGFPLPGLNQSTCTQNRKISPRKKMMGSSAHAWKGSFLSGILLRLLLVVSTFSTQLPEGWLKHVIMSFLCSSVLSGFLLHMKSSLSFLPWSKALGNLFPPFADLGSATLISLLFLKQVTSFLLNTSTLAFLWPGTFLFLFLTF